MNSKKDVINAWVEEEWANPPASLTAASEKYLSDDFVNIDQEGNVIANKEAYIAMAQASAASFTGFKVVISDLQEVSDGVIMTNHFEGTHTGDFDLSALGLGVIPASGKKIVWPDTKSKFTVEGDQITGIHEISGGLEYFLAPLGVKLPSS
jgi:hypothetical protein